MGTTNGHLHAHQSAHSPITWQDILQSHCTQPARHLLPCGHIPVSTRALVGTHKTSLQHNHVRWPRFPQVPTATAMGTTAPASRQNSPLGKGDANCSKSSHLLCATLSAKDQTTYLPCHRGQSLPDLVPLLFLPDKASSGYTVSISRFWCTPTQTLGSGLAATQIAPHNSDSHRCTSQ